MSSHRSLTDEYMANLPRSLDRAANATDGVQASALASSYLGRALSRPVFLGKAEYDQLASDVENLTQALVALPERLFDGDVAACARAEGMTEDMIAAMLRCPGPPTRSCRADLIQDETGFRILELNMASTIGGLDNALLNDGMLTVPYVADFVSKHGLTYIDTMTELAETMLDECGLAPGSNPVMAAADWPQSFETLQPQLDRSAALLRERGVDAYACHVGQLRFEDGRVWLGERPVDFVYRLFGMDDYLSGEGGRELCEPVLAATERGEVGMFVAMDGRLYGSKGLLARLSDDANRHLLTEAERQSIDRILPWTRMLRSATTTVDGETVDMPRYVLAERENLVLKPSLMYGGIGVVPGWLTEPDEWRKSVEAAMDGPYVVQRRIIPVPELFPTEEGFEEWALVWGVFVMKSGRGGIWIRGTKGAVSGVANTAQGASGTCCFIATS